MNAVASRSSSEVEWRKAYHEGCSATGGVFDGNVTTMVDRNLLHDRKTEARTGDVARVGGAVKTLEDAGFLGIGDAAAVVNDPQFVALDMHFDGAGGG